MSACRSCGAEVIWCVTEQGKRMPIDAQPVERGGNVCVFECPETAADMCRVLTKDELSTWTLDDGRLHTSHFATCPNAAKHRSKNGKARPGAQ